MASFRRALINTNQILKSSVFTAARTRKSQNDSIARHFCSSNGGTTSESSDIDFSTGESRRRLVNRLLYRSKQRGLLELDLVLGKWVEENIDSMDENGIKSLVHVLDLENPDLWRWLSGQEQPPEAVMSNPVFLALHGKVMNNLSSYSAPETRAVPGDAWVRGWDDFKKGRDGPISGNQ